MLCVHHGTLRSVFLAEEPGFGTSPALVSPAQSQGLAPLLEGGRHGGGCVCKPHGPGVGAGGCLRASGALGKIVVRRVGRVARTSCKY